ncbi:MAG: crotonobetainyl-CoA:carnitine CoA-transferase CaiB-like acyl-CoA transferase, partial [Acidimicrobiales bacterium]
MFADLGSEVGLSGLDARRPFYDDGKHLLADPVEASGVHVADADIVIQSSSVDPLAQLLEPASSTQIVVRISPFPSAGPYGAWRSTDLVDAAISGHLRLSGDPGREPLQGVPDIVHHAAGVMAFISTTAALIARVRSGSGQVVEITHQEVLAALHQFTLCRFTHNGAILERLGNRYAGAGTPIGGYECADGSIGIAAPQSDQMERLLEVTGLVSMLERDDVGSLAELMTSGELFNSEFRPYLLTQRRDELVELFQALRIPCAPSLSMEELLADDHLASREFWQGADGYLLPGPPFRMSDHRWSTEPKSSQGPLPNGTGPATDLSDGPLTGLRVIDMTRVWAGPLATRILADLGAEVVMTEVPWTRTPLEVPDAYVEATHFFPDDEAGARPWNRSAFHNKYANNKLSTVIELDKEEGRALFADLIPTADVLIENYSPRVMPGFGFDEDTLHRLNPDLIYVTMPGYGRDGPLADWVAYGPTIDSHVGHTSLTGYRGEGPWKCGIAWPDPIGGMHGAAAALVGLLDRLSEPESRGQTVEVAQIESAINMIGQHVVGSQLDGAPQRWGNRRPGRGPQGVYPCAGDDRWIAISVVDERSWNGLCDVTGFHDLRHLDAEERWAAHDRIDARLAVFTRAASDIDLMHRLQSAGVPAGAASDAADVMDDPQLA